MTFLRKEKIFLLQAFELVLNRLDAMLLVLLRLLISLPNPHPTNAHCWKGIKEVEGNHHLLMAYYVSEVYCVVN